MSLGDEIRSAAGVSGADTTPDSNLSIGDQIRAAGSVTQPTSQEKKKLSGKIDTTNIADTMYPMLGAGENVLQGVTGLGASIWGGLSGLATLVASGGDTDKATQVIRDAQDALTYEPKTDAGKNLSAASNAVTGEINKGWGLIGKSVAGDAGQAVGEQVFPVVSALAAGQQALTGAKGLRTQETNALPEQYNGVKVGSKTVPASGFGENTAGAAQASRADMAASEGANPRLVSMIKDAESKGPLTTEQSNAIDAHIDADKVGVQLLKGQATDNGALKTAEMDNRGLNPKLGEAFKQQNADLVNALPGKIIPESTPDIYNTLPKDDGQSLIDMYKKHDAVLNEGINQAYEALSEKANALKAQGISAPIDAPKLANNILKTLDDNQLDASSLTPEIQKALVKMQNNDFGFGGVSRPMNFQDFKTLRSLIGNQQLENAGTTIGTALKHARNQLENLPLTGAAAELKPFLTDASNLAKQRFDLIDADPAYSSSIANPNSPAYTHPQDFTKKFIINGTREDVINMKNNLGADPISTQLIEHSALLHLKDASLPPGSVNFANSGYARALDNLNKTNGDVIFKPETLDRLNALQRTATRIVGQKKDTTINNSNTASALIKSGAVKTAEGLVNMKTGIGGTIAKNAYDNWSKGKAADESLRFGAGIDK